MNATELTECNENMHSLLSLARDLSVPVDGPFEWAAYEEDIGSLLSPYADDPARIANMVAYGDYQPGDGWLYWLNGYGNVESSTMSDLLDRAWNEREDIINADDERMYRNYEWITEDMEDADDYAL